MKKLTNTLPIILLSITLAFVACKKNEAPNTAPAASAGNDTTFKLTTSILLDGSASTDKENNIDSYAWKLVSGPAGANIARPDLAKTAVTNMVKGIYQFELTVTDRAGLSSTDKIQVSVLTVLKVADTIIRLPYNRALLQVEDNNNNNTFKWEKISGPTSFNIHHPDFKSSTVTNLVEGVYQFEITIIHSTGLTEKDIMTVTVLPDNNIYTTERLFENLVLLENTNSPVFTISPINNISLIIPTNIPFKVYAKPNFFGSDWEIAISEESDPKYLYFYNYTIKNNVMIVSANLDPLGYVPTPIDAAIKIVY